MSEEEFSDESLKKSIDATGPLYEVLVSEDGEVLDGKHRLAVNPNHPKKTVPAKTRIEKILVRLHAHHRRRVPREETQALILELAHELEKETAKENVATELVKWLPYNESYIRRLLPDEYKSSEMADVARLRVREKMPETPKEVQIKKIEPPVMVQCSCCPLGTYSPKDWNGFPVCPSCYDKLSQGKITLTAPKATVEKPSEVREYKPKETWAHRKAVMSPPVSKMEMLVLTKLAQQGKTPETQKVLCARPCRPDYYYELPSGPLAIFLDGPVHQGREDRDEELRTWLSNQGIRVVSIPYENPSESEAEDIAEKILEALNG